MSSGWRVLWKQLSSITKKSDTNLNPRRLRDLSSAVGAVLLQLGFAVAYAYNVLENPPHIVIFTSIPEGYITNVANRLGIFSGDGLSLMPYSRYYIQLGTIGLTVSKKF